MSLRLLQIVLPRRHRDELAHVLANAAPPDRWSSDLSDELLMTTVLLRAKAVEPLSDALTEAFSSVDGYRLIILPAQASFPVIEEPEPEPKADPESKTPANGERPPWKPIIGRVSREELQESISTGGATDGLFLSMTVLATVVAAAGLMKDSPAVIIGAMVIAPLLGPNIALALGTTLGDRPLIRRCVRTNAIGVGLAMVLSIGIGAVSMPSPETGEIAARTAVDAGDIALAFASGAAGALAFTAGAQATVVGVMVAVALLPPAVVCGMMIGAGEWRAMAGAAVMLGVNVVSVNLAATLVFLIQGVRPDRWWQQSNATRSTRLAIILWLVLLTMLATLLLIWF